MEHSHNNESLDMLYAKNNLIAVISHFHLYCSWNFSYSEVDSKTFEDSQDRLRTRSLYTTQTAGEISEKQAILSVHTSGSLQQ